MGGKQQSKLIHPLKTLLNNLVITTNFQYQNKSASQIYLHTEEDINLQIIYQWLTFSNVIFHNELTCRQSTTKK